ncbi:MAG TPA: hypothetical protein PK833_11595, partial [Vicingus sp.]|nr:hypothetical protein [Vicingus sp.]
MNKNKIKGIIAFVLIWSVYACNVNPSIMMRTKKNFKYDTNPGDSTIEYRIRPSDILGFQLFTNEGTRLIDLTALSSSENRMMGVISPNYLVEHD